MTEPNPQAIIINVDHSLEGHVIVEKNQWYKILKILTEGGAELIHTFDDTIAAK